MTLALDILNEIADRKGWAQIDSLESRPLDPDTRKLLGVFNRVLVTLGGLNDWTMLRAEGSLLLTASETSDLTVGLEEFVTATIGSDVVTVANKTFDDTHIDRAFQVNGDEYIYRIIAKLAAGQIKLDKVWVNASIVVADKKTYTIAQDRYDLPVDFDRPINDFQGFFGTKSIEPISPEEFRKLRRARRDITLGDPHVFTVFGLNTKETAERVHFHRFPEFSRRLNFDYQMVHPTIERNLDKLLFDRRYINFIIDMCLQLLYRDYDDDVRMQQTLVDMLRSYNQQLSNPSVAGSKLQLRPRNMIRQNMSRAMRLGSLRINWGSYFDNVSNIRLP